MIDQWHPNEVIFEDIQLQKDEFGENVITYKTLAMLQGVLKNYCYEHGVPYKIVPPGTWREHSGVKGKTRSDRKKSGQIRVKYFYNLDVSNDVADAILLGRYASAPQTKVPTIMF